MSGHGFGPEITEEKIKQREDRGRASVSGLDLPHVRHVEGEMKPDRYYKDKCTLEL
jgi:hypothetical protein